MPGIWEIGGDDRCDVFLAIPTLNTVSRLWAMDLFQVARATSGMNIKVGSWQGMPVDKARNLLVKDAQKNHARWIWFVDSDVHVPQDTLQALMYWRLPIVSGLVYAKQSRRPAVWNRDGEGYRPLDVVPAKTIIEVDAIPMGCCLIDMRVFEHIPPKWFDFEIDDPFNGDLSRLSEDFYFCRKAQEAGFSVYCWTGATCLHEEMVLRQPNGYDMVYSHPTIK